jgi:glycosyltransferase involved in cell wall biosynthesis
MKKSLRIWFLQVGEPLPYDDGPPRLLRSAILARELAARGHHVIYWNARFNHQTKIMRDQRLDGAKTSDGYETRLLRGRAYSKNISPTRVLCQRENAADFLSRAPSEHPPDVIVCGFPTIELARAGTKFAAKAGIPVVVDCRDMWPDIFEAQVSGFKKIVAQPLFAHWRYEKRKVMQAARSIVGITEPFVEWGLESTGRPRSELDRVFHLAVSPNAPSTSELTDADRRWSIELGPKTDATIRISFAGTLSSRIALHQLIDVLKQNRFKRLQFVMCGRGDLEHSLVDLAKSHPNFVMAGWRSHADISSLLSSSDLGLLPYSNAHDFLASYPNKVGEYLSAGLPILTGLGGITGKLLRDNQIGFFYDNDSADSIRNALFDLDENMISDHTQKERARAVYLSQFDPNKIYPEFADHIEKVADLKMVGRAL